jgi:hypothetical protein
MKRCNFSQKGPKEGERERERNKKIKPKSQPVFELGTPACKVDELPCEPNANKDSIAYCLSGTTHVHVRNKRDQFHTITCNVHSPIHAFRKVLCKSNSAQVGTEYTYEGSPRST